MDFSTHNPPLKQESPAEIILSRPPKESDGEATHSRYYWQTQVATRRIFELLLAHLSYRNSPPVTNEWMLVCEWHEDFCILRGSEAQICAVKHRETTRRKWEIKELIVKGGLLHLFSNWWYLDRACQASLYTNSELLGNKAQKLKLATDILRGNRRGTLLATEETLIHDVVEAMGHVALDAHHTPGDFLLPQELLSPSLSNALSTSLRRHLREFLGALTLITDLPARQFTDALSDSGTIRLCLEYMGIPSMLTEHAWETVEALVLQGMRGEGDARSLEHNALGLRLLWDPDWKKRPEFGWATRTLGPRQVMEALRTRARSIHIGRHGTPRIIEPPVSSFIDNTRTPWSQLPWDQGPILITGGAGMGKTSTARHFAKVARPEFPHGQLLVDTRGFGPSAPMSTEEIIETLLAQLGERCRTNDETLEERRLRFIDIIETGRYLVVLDNVSDVETIRPLLPGERTSAVIITSRRPLSALMISHQATPVRMDPLPADKAHELFERLISDGRLDTDPVSAKRLLAVCGGIPLAITILAALLNQLPGHPLSRFLSELDDPDGRLDLLDLGEQYSSIRTVFSWTYRALTPALREAFVLFGSCPAPHLDIDAVGKLFKENRSRNTLRRLQQFNLLIERPDGRFQMHDLLRDYATSLSNESDDIRGKRDQANVRIAKYYARIATNISGTAPHDSSEHWLHQNIDALISIITYCSQNGAVDDLCAITDAITEYLWFEGRWVDCTNALKYTLSALVPETPPEKKAHYLRQLSVTLRRRGLHDESIRYAHASLTALESTESEVDASDSHYELAVVYSYDGLHEKAVAHYRNALQVFRAHQDQNRIGDALNGLGWSISESGDPAAGLTYCQQAWAIHRSSNDLNREAADLDSIAYIQHRLGDHEASLKNYRSCLRIYAKIHHRSNEARTLESMGDLYKDMGDTKEARSSWERAHTLFKSIDSSSGEEIKRKYARGPVDPRLIRGVLRLWVRGMKGIGSVDLDPGEVFGLIDSIPFTWREQKVDLREQVITPGGTAEPVPSLYRLLPDFLARLIRLSGPFTGPSGHRHSFLESPGSAQRSELVSWPPMTDQRGEAGAKFSYVITISVQTIPFTSRFRVHVRTGVRRWVSQVGSGGTLYTGARSVSVHLLTTSDWEGVSGERSRLFVNRLSYHRGEGTHVWRVTDGPDIPSAASILARMPEPRELTGAPARWIGGVDGVVAAIPYNTKMGSHDVGAGLMAGERVPLMNWIDDALSPFLRRAPVCEQISLPNHPLNFPKTPQVPARASGEERKRIRTEKVQEQQRQEVRERRDLLRELLDGAPFIARVHWQETETRDALVAALRDLLDLPLPEPADDEILSWHLPDLEVHLQLRPSGTLTSSLELSDGSKTTAKDLQGAIRRRRDFAKTTMRGKDVLEKPTNTTKLPLVALVEIEAEVKDRRSDPKFAVRLGCAGAGVITQFIQTAATKNLKKSRAHRARMSWLDAFRQLGVSRVPRHTFTDSLPPDLQYVSVWMAKRRWDGPTRKPTWRLLALRVRPEDGVRAVCGWRPDTRRWIPYREYLLWLASDVDHAEAAENQYGESLSKEEPHEEQQETQQAEQASSFGRTEGTREERRRKTNALLRPLIAQLKGRPSLLMAHAQNLRDSWTWLRNGDLEADLIWLDDGEEGLPIHHWGRGLRLLRVRDSDGDETPQWYGTGDKHGLPTGIWPVIDTPDQRVFYSSTDKSPTAKNASVEAVKDGTRRNKAGKVVSDTDKDASNPNLLEITVLALQDKEESDVPREWAACAHQMRYAPDIKAPLALPYPLHMVKSAVEYVLPTSEE